MLVLSVAFAGCSDAGDDADPAPVEGGDDSIDTGTDDVADTDQEAGTDGEETPVDDIVDDDEVEPPAPTLDDLQFSADVAQGGVPLDVTFSTSGTGDLDFEWTLVLDDGADEQTGSDDVSVAHTYTSLGVFEATLSAQADGETVTRTASVEVTDLSCDTFPVTISSDGLSDVDHMAEDILCFGTDYDGADVTLMAYVLDPSDLPESGTTYHFEFWPDYGQYIHNRVLVEWDGTDLNATWERDHGGLFNVDWQEDDDAEVSTGWDGHVLSITFPVEEASHADQEEQQAPSEDDTWDTVAVRSGDWSAPVDAAPDQDGQILEFSPDAVAAMNGSESG